MFVSKKAATERLSSRDNIFRDKDVPLSSEAPEVSGSNEQEILEIPDGEVISESPSSNPKSKNEKKENNDALDKEPTTKRDARYTVDEGAEDLRGRDSFAKLDALIYDKVNGRANYQGKLASQIGIGEVALMIGQKNAGDLFGLSRPQAEAYAHGLDSPRQMTDGIGAPRAQARVATRRAHLNNLKEIVAEKAAVKLGEALDILTTDKIKRLKATNVVRAAKDLSTIVRNMEGEEKTDDSVHFHIYKPEIKQENHYETINVGAKA